jgi:hypothetical protein
MHHRERSLRRLTLLACLSAFLLLSGARAMAVEEPAYVVLKSEPPFELREYPGFVVAETRVEGDFDAASRAGFRRIARYIFGGNKDSDGRSRSISMTAPVTVEQDGEQWRLHFVMPSGSELSRMPEPLDGSVNLREVPAHRMAAVRFSGWTTDASIARHAGLLRDWLTAKGIAFEDRPQVARYDDPFTLPWNRRNEILIPLRY